MGGFLGLIGALLVIIWALSMQINTARTNESLHRIEELLKQQNAKEKK